ncbi:endonuclease domain-containing protein [Sphingomonas sp.]|uniref:endonuclease domain-containing protein n=1 Tax=Sphingomonas sp. TaxID=28214 RepID=UPI003B00E8EB
MRHGGKAEVTKRSRDLRKVMSPTEVRLWNVLRRNRELHVRKQHPCGAFTLDFFVASRGLVIEVDGESHNRGDRPERDIARDAWLASQGLTTLRIPAIEVLRNLDGVLTQILTAASLPLHHRPTAGGPPPPQSGGGR